MSLKGFPTSQKLVSNQPSRHEFTTIQPTDNGLRYALDTVAKFAFRVGSATVARTAGANTGNPTDGSGTVVVDTTTPAMVGDFVRFIDGDAAYLEIPIIDVDTNSFKLGARLTDPPASGDEFFIMRYATQRVDQTGSQQVTATQGPTQFNLNGNPVEVTEDTTTPANNIALPVKEINLGGSNVEGTVSVAATITAPSKAVGFILMNEDISTTNMRYKIGGTAGAASGQQLQPGRDTGYVPCGADISICAESGTCNYNIQWIKTS